MEAVSSSEASEEMCDPTWFNDPEGYHNLMYTTYVFSTSKLVLLKCDENM
jgi:hypothetical protein